MAKAPKRGVENDVVWRVWMARNAAIITVPMRIHHDVSMGHGAGFSRTVGSIIPMACVAMAVIATERIVGFPIEILSSTTNLVDMQSISSPYSIVLTSVVDFSSDLEVLGGRRTSPCFLDPKSSLDMQFDIPTDIRHLPWSSDGKLVKLRGHFFLLHFFLLHIQPPDSSWQMLSP